MLLCTAFWLADTPTARCSSLLPLSHQQELEEKVRSVLADRNQSPAEKLHRVSQLRDGIAIGYISGLEKSQAWPEYISTLRAFRLDGNILSADASAVVFARAAKVIAQLDENDFRAVAGDFATVTLKQMEIASLKAQDEGILVLVGKYLPQLGRVAPLDAVDRKAALGSYLNLIQGVELHLEKPRPTVDQAHVWKPGRVMLMDPAFGRDEEEKARYESALKTHHKHQDEYRIYSEDDAIRYHFDNPADARKPKLEKEMAAFVNKRFTSSVEDLSELQQLFEKHIRSPELRQRLILATFNGTNPFLGLPGQAQVSKRSSWLDRLLALKAREQAVAGPATKNSATDQHPSASGPLASTTAVSGRTTGLWAAFAGAGALILFVLWRAQARGNPGRGK